MTKENLKKAIELNCLLEDSKKFAEIMGDFKKFNWQINKLDYVFNIPQNLQDVLKKAINKEIERIENELEKL